MSVYDRILEDALACESVPPRGLVEAVHRANARYLADKIMLERLREEQDAIPVPRLGASPLALSPPDLRADARFPEDDVSLARRREEQDVEAQRSHRASVEAIKRRWPREQGIG